MNSSDPTAGGLFDKIFQTGTPVPPTGIDKFASVELIVGCVLIILATLVYGIGFKWWQRRAGRAILGVLASISLLLLHLTVSRLVGGDYLFRDLIRALTYLALPVSVCYLLYALIRSFFGGAEGDEVRVDRLRRLPADVDSGPVNIAVVPDQLKPALDKDSGAASN